MILDHTAVLNDLRTRLQVYHQSNIFFRDIQYGIQSMLSDQGIRVSYKEAERLARQFAERMEQEKIFVARDRQTWALRYPEFKTPRVERAEAAAGKTPAPASGAQAAAPAGGSVKAPGAPDGENRA